MGNNKIGSKTSFWKLISGDKINNILIPSIQRDYTYGAQTEDTNKVLDNLLNNIRKTLFEKQADDKPYPEMILNFVYGYSQEKINFVPLDGQQRLTTLFLLHYYAALNDGNSDFSKLERFTYATRETTKTYCQEIIRHRSDILDSLKSGNGIRQAIEDMPWFIPGFNNDPSIRSMQVVFERIEQIFASNKAELWKKLTNEDCPISFYLLNFGPFHLSDDLYVKMNSRGKKLTEYEIFKSILLKHIEKTLGNRPLKRKLAIKFDNEWTDMVWECIGKPKQEEKLTSIDEAYILLMKLVLRYLSYLHGQTANEDSTKLNLENISRLLDDTKYVRFLEDFLDVFSQAQRKLNGIDKATDLITSGISQITDRRKYSFRGCLMNDSIKNGDILFLYGIYYGLKTYLLNPGQLDLIILRIRHLRNIIENSENEIRDDRMPALISDVHRIMSESLDPANPGTFNKNQWQEECEKQSHVDEWKQLWPFEEHPLLSGSLASFAENQNLDLGDSDSIKLMTERLKKFNYIFDNNFKENDRLIRAALLTVDDYSQYLRTYDQYRILGNISLCWRPMFVKNESRHRQEVVMEILDKLVVNTQIGVKPYLEGLIDKYLSNPTTQKDDWRYYVIKYRNHTYKGYTHNDSYGYYFIEDQSKLLEVAILQSSGFGSTNVAWYLLPLILTERNSNKYHLSLGTHAAREEEENIEISTKDYPLQLGISAQYGWCLYGLPEDEAKRIGLNYTYFDSNTNMLGFKLAQTDDYIEWAEKNIFPALTAL